MFTIVIGAFLSMMLFMNIITKLWTLWNNQNDINETNSIEEGRLNNSAYNKELASAVVEITTSIFISVVRLSIAFGVPSEPNNFQKVNIGQQLSQDLGPSFLSMVVAPTVIYSVNQALRKYALEFYAQLVK